MAGCSADQLRFRVENLAWKNEKTDTFGIAIYYLQIGLIVVGLICCTLVVLFLADQVSVLRMNTIVVLEAKNLRNTYTY